MEERHNRRIQERGISYARSDGSPPWDLRWGAGPDTEENATCKRRAPAPQNAKMEQYRVWFRELRRPPR